MRAIPSSLIIIDGAYSMDGGSIYLEMEEPDEVKGGLHPGLALSRKARSYRLETSHR